MNVSLSSSSRSSLNAMTQAGLLAGPFLSMLDSNIVNVALPDIALQLHSSLETAQWIVSGYLLALATSAYLAKRFGTSRVYLASLLGFTMASTLCALAPTMGFLIATRALQGALGAPLVPLAMGMLLGQGGAARQMPPAAGIVLFLAPAIGPTIGGLLLHLDWCWPFMARHNERSLAGQPSLAGPTWSVVSACSRCMSSGHPVMRILLWILNCCGIPNLPLPLDSQPWWRLSCS